MPVYLVHGFRWPRDGYSGIRVHAIVHNLEDCSVEYIQNENSRDEILKSFRDQFPELMKEIEVDGRSLEFIEQYDPEDVESSNVVSQPYAYVADKLVEIAGQSIVEPATREKNGRAVIPLSINVEDIIASGPGLTSKASEAIAELRDKIATGEKIGWWVVYNGDPDRDYEDTDEEEEEEEGASTPTAESAASTTTTPAKETAPEREPAQPKESQGPPVPPKIAATEKSSFSKLLPTRNKQDTVKPEAVLQTPKDENIPDPPKLKDTAKSSGFRKKFFGKKI